MVYKDPFSPRAANTPAQAGDNGTAGACPKKWKAQRGGQVQVDSRGPDCHASYAAGTSSLGLGREVLRI